MSKSRREVHAMEITGGKVLRWLNRIVAPSLRSLIGAGMERPQKGAERWFSEQRPLSRSITAQGPGRGPRTSTKENISERKDSRRR